MIVFDLACAQGHRFEGWFASAEDFARQAAAAQVGCPICNDTTIARVPSAKVRVGQASPPEKKPAEAAPPGENEVVAGLPAELIAKLRDAIRSTENVGRRFPEEARKIHYEEAPARPIRGQASREESAELAEEGIEFSSLPEFLTRELQ